MYKGTIYNLSALMSQGCGFYSKDKICGWSFTIKIALRRGVMNAVVYLLDEFIICVDVIDNLHSRLVTRTQD